MQELTDRQMKIVQAAIKLVSEHSIEGVTISNIASEVGVTEPAIYRHFKSKAEIMVAILSLFSTMSRTIIQSVISQKSGALDRIELFHEKLFGQFAQQPALAAVIFSEEYFLGDSRLSEIVNGVITNVHAMIVKQISEDSSLARAGAPDHLAHIVMGTFRMIVKKWHISRNQFDLVCEGKATWGTLRRLIETSASSG